MPVVGGPEYRAMYPGQSEDEQHYYAVITALDEQVGRLRGRLRSLGWRTTRSSGSARTTARRGTPVRRGRSQGTAGPFRGRKRSLYEGGVRVPAILEWPSRIEGPRTTEVPAVTSDYVPTILDAIGRQAPDPSERPLDGISLLPLIEGTMEDRPHPIAFRFGSQAALSDNRFKLVHNENDARPRSDNGTTPIARWELYDLIADPGETRNVADRHPEVVERMRATLSAWRDSCEADAARAAD